MDHLDEHQLAVLLAGLVFEPRKGAHLPKLARPHEKLLREVRDYSKRIFKIENRLRVFPYTRTCHFHLSAAIEAWSYGISFDDVFKHTDVDEGELVRYFRMVIQLVRELRLNPHSSDILKKTADRARTLINRDVVDAEKQLRV